MAHDKTLKDYIGNNEKTKIIVKLQKVNTIHTCVCLPLLILISDKFLIPQQPFINCMSKYDFVTLHGKNWPHQFQSLLKNLIFFKLNFIDYEFISLCYANNYNFICSLFHCIERTRCTTTRTSCQRGRTKENDGLLS